MQRRIDFLIDVSDSFEDKVRALQAYKSQFYENKKNMKIFDWIRHRAANLGFEIGVEYAEAFISPTYFQIHDITKL